MPIIALILTLDVTASVLLISFPIHLPQKDSRTLGQSIYLVQDETPPPDQTPLPDQNPPADQTPPPDTTTTEPAPAGTTIQPTETTPTTTETTPAETTPPQPESSSPAAATTTGTHPPASPETNAASQETPEQSASASADLPILNTDELINNPSQVDTGSQAEVSKEEQALDQITDPSLKAAALTIFASDKISDIDRFTHSQDFNSITFASQRLSNQIDELKSISSRTPDNVQIRQKLSDLCQQVNTTLRTNQEIVPEELEQDLEITRGQCLGY